MSKKKSQPKPPEEKKDFTVSVGTSWGIVTEYKRMTPSDLEKYIATLFKEGHVYTETKTMRNIITPPHHITRIEVVEKK